jgi:EAL domain-containing protein (putative c-di-GMP-specific phosphodiesterase class I)
LTILKKNNCKPNWIEIEVTESYVMNSPEQAIDTLQSLKDTGINISIDDFGTGYSSLVYLKRLPLNKLKIDQYFTRDIVNEADDRAIIESIISLASTMNLDVIAEGVETKEQIDFLQSKACFWVQGYIFGHPVRTDEISKMLSKIK